ncbi:MAG: TraB/GumN family protein [Caulobacteraceae bacterium]
MKLHRILGLFGAIWLVLAAPARADDPQAAVVDELVVQASSAGPAWWRVSDGDSVVWIMSTPGALPRGQAWDKSLMTLRLTGANELILPSTGQAGLRDLPALYGLLRGLKGTGALEPSLPPALRDRFVAARTQLRQKPSRYEKLSPFGAAMTLLSDYGSTLRFDGSQPLAAIRQIARAKRVTARPATTYPIVPLFRNVERNVTPAIGLACLEDALTEVEAGAVKARATGPAWARGDVRGALAAQRGFEKCLSLLPGIPDRTRQDMAAETAAVVRALGRPGHAVAVLPLRGLVARGGVLEQLRARGYEVRTPASAN